MSIKKNYGYNLFNSFLNIAFPIFTFPYAARILSPDGIGQTQFIFSYAQYFALLAAFGIPIYGVKVISEARDNQAKLNKATTELLLISTVNMVIVLTIYISSIMIIGQFKDNQADYLLASLLIVMSVFNVDWFFSGKEQFKIIAIRSGLIKTVAFILLFITVRNSDDITAYLFFLVFLYIGNYALNFFFLFRYVKLDFREIIPKKHLRPLVLILSMTIATTIYTTLDSVLLGFLSNTTEVGYYTAAVKLSKVSIPILTSLGIVALPKITGMIQSNNQLAQQSLYEKSFSFISFLAIPMCLGIYLLRTETILLFSGEEFMPAAQDVAALAFLPLFIGFGHFAAFQVLLPLNQNKSLFISTVVGMCLFFGLCFLLVPKSGSTGAAISNTVTELIVTVCYFMFFPKYILLSLPWKKLITAGLAVLPFVPIVLFLQSQLKHSLTIIILAISMCSLVYVLIQYYIFKEKLIIDSLTFLRNGKKK